MSYPSRRSPFAVRVVGVSLLLASGWFARSLLAGPAVAPGHSGGSAALARPEDVNDALELARLRSSVARLEGRVDELSAESSDSLPASVDHGTGSAAPEPASFDDMLSENTGAVAFLDAVLADEGRDEGWAAETESSAGSAFGSGALPGTLESVRCGRTLCSAHVSQATNVSSAQFVQRVTHVPPFDTNGQIRQVSATGDGSQWVVFFSRRGLVVPAVPPHGREGI